MKYIVLPTIAAILFSCGSQNSKETNSTITDTAIGAVAEQGMGGRRVTTSTGKIIMLIEEHPIGMSLSDIKVVAAGMGDTIRFKDADPVSELLQGDLDNDGFDELYIVTSTAGSGNYGKVIGLSSVGDSSFQKILIPSFEQDAKPYQGYMGGDKFSVEKNSLVRSFPVYQAGDVNGKPTGGSMMVQYRLMKKGNDLLLLEANR
jgi:hypothetical protein